MKLKFSQMIQLNPRNNRKGPSHLSWETKILRTLLKVAGSVDVLNPFNI